MTSQKSLPRASHPDRPPAARRPGGRRTSARRLAFEGLEGRALLTAFWDGGGDGVHWNDPRNWQGDALPTPTEAAVVSNWTSEIEIASTQGATIQQLRSTAPVKILPGGQLSLTAPNSLVSSIADLEVDGGRLSVGYRLNVGKLTWTGGEITGAGLTVVTGTLETSGATKILNGHRLYNRGSGTMLLDNPWAAGQMELKNAAQFVNDTTGSLTIRVVNAQWTKYAFTSTTQDGLITNKGTLAKSDNASTAIVNAVLRNAGSVKVTAGVLSLRGGGTHSGSFQVEAGAMLGFHAGSHQLTSTSAVRGGGTVQFINVPSEGTLTRVLGAYAPASTVLTNTTVEFRTVGKDLTTRSLSLQGKSRMIVAPTSTFRVQGNVAVSNNSTLVLQATSTSLGRRCGRMSVSGRVAFENAWGKQPTIEVQVLPGARVYRGDLFPLVTFASANGLCSFQGPTVAGRPVFEFLRNGTSISARALRDYAPPAAFSSPGAVVSGVWPAQVDQVMTQLD